MDTMKLWEISDQLEQLLQANTDEETGEINPVCYAQLEALEIAKDKKACDVACFIKHLEGEAKTVGEFIKSFSARRESLNRRARSLRQYLADQCRGEKYKDQRVSIYWGKSQAVVISDMTRIPDSYLKPLTEESVKKSAVKDAIAAGKDVPGCSIQENTNLVIR